MDKCFLHVQCYFGHCLFSYTETTIFNSSIFRYTVPLFLCFQVLSGPVFLLFGIILLLLHQAIQYISVGTVEVLIFPCHSPLYFNGPIVLLVQSKHIFLLLGSSLFCVV